MAVEIPPSDIASPVDLDRIRRTFSSKHWDWIVESAEPLRLTGFLSERLPHIEPSSWPERLAWGGAYVNGSPARGDVTLFLPARIEYYEPAFSIAEAESYFPRFDPGWIVYEDEHVGVCYKPSRLPTMAGREQPHFNLKGYLERHYGHPLHFPSRIDTSTQGLVLFSKRRETHNLLNEIFADRKISKRYLFVTDRRAALASLECHLPIGKDEAHPVLRRVHGIGAKHASTFFSLRACHGRDEPRYLWEAHPVTGRTHQIRVHARELGIPIVGDNFYGGGVAEMLHLLAYSVELIHPLREEHVAVRVPDRLLPSWVATFGCGSPRS